MKPLIKTSLLLALMISCNIGGTQNIPLGMRTDVDWELIEAAKLGDMQEVARLLEEQGADIETRDYDVDDDTEYTPLHHACEQGHEEVVSYLVRRGADVDAATSTKGRTPLHYACMAGHLGIVKFLINNKADVKKVDCQGGLPLHYAAAAGCLDIVKYFHGIGIDMNKAGEDGSTPLHVAAGQGKLAVVQYLHSIGVGVRQQDDCGMTPLHYAVLGSQEDVVRFFAGINEASFINLQTEEGNTVLHFAASRGYKEIFELLLAAGADATIKNNKGTTPLARARRKGHAAIVTLLEQYMPDQEISHKRDTSPPVPPTQPLPKRSKHAVEMH